MQIIEAYHLVRETAKITSEKKLPNVQVAIYNTIVHRGYSLHSCHNTIMMEFLTRVIHKKKNKNKITDITQTLITKE